MFVVRSNSNKCDLRKSKVFPTCAMSWNRIAGMGKEIFNDEKSE